MKIKKIKFLKKKASENLKYINKKLSKEIKVNLKFNYKQFIAVTFILSPFYSLFYYDYYLGGYGVNLFLYLSPEDLIFGVYKNIKGTVLICSVLMFSIAGLIVIFKDLKRSNRFFIFLILIMSFVEFLLFFFGCRRSVPFIPLLSILIILLAIKYIFIWGNKNVIYGYIGVITVFFVFKGKEDYRMSKKNKLTFDLVLNEKTDKNLMKEKDTTTYWVGSLSKTIFIYDTRIKKVRAIPNSRIKEIRYTN